MKQPIVIVGLGAIGSHAALLLRNRPEGLRLVDFDRVEQKNTLAQLHTRMSLGRNKAQAMGQVLQGFFGLKTEVIPHRLGPDNADALLSEARLILDCTDNIEARRTIAAAAIRLGRPCLHGALSGDGSFGRIGWTGSFSPDAENDAGAPTCEDGQHLPFFALVGAQLACAAQRFLDTGRKEGFQLTPGGVVRV